MDIATVAAYSICRTIRKVVRQFRDNSGKAIGLFRSCNSKSCKAIRKTIWKLQDNSEATGQFASCRAIRRTVGQFAGLLDNSEAARQFAEQLDNSQDCWTIQKKCCTCGGIAVYMLK
jgi:hypothetical protein